MMRIVGMMSGTSLDGVDAVLAEYRQTQTNAGNWLIRAHAEAPIPPSLRKTLYQLNFPGRVNNELHAAKIAEQQLTACYAEAFKRLLAKTPLSVGDITAIAAHGQTIRHAPNGDFPYTLQLLNGALLSHLTDCTVVCDFRSKDVAAGGQGAPLAPLFHRELFIQHAPCAVVNIGGISNMSVVDGDGVSGFDCGPGNCLLDEWIAKHLCKSYDENGDWARRGQVLPDLLARCLSDDFFAQRAPKSTGRDYFNRHWLDERCSGAEKPVDVMRTLVRLTATAIADAVPIPLATVVVAGGGAKNSLLLADLQHLLPHCTVRRTDDMGIDAQHVEALGFALLGRATLLRQAADTRAITGATQAVVLGAVYSA